MISYSKSVTELTSYIRHLFDEDMTLQDVWVKGEISNMTRAASGHWYFTLKDNKAQLRCVMWRSSASRQSATPQNGDAVEVHGSVNVYEPRGEYQLYADAVQMAGLGDLYQQFERLKAKLAAEGLFDAERKRGFPAFPHQIGIVTSPTAAAFQDVQNVLRRRFPLAHLILSPTLVQGTEAPAQIVQAIQRLNDHTEVDLILLIRGGGSIEDLWAFNDERVAYAVASSRIPIMTGVGHETDFTIADFISDERAPTPSAAAEQATPDAIEMLEDLTALRLGLQNTLWRRITTAEDRLNTTTRALHRATPQNTISRGRQRIDDLTLRITHQQHSRITLLKERLGSRAAALNAANPEALLKRGYAIITRSDDGGRIVSELDGKPGMGITIRLKDGELKARIEDKDSHDRYKRTLF